MRPILRPPSFSRGDFLSLLLVRLLVDLWTYRFFLLHKPLWNFAEVEFRPDHRTSRLFASFIFYDFFHRHFRFALSYFNPRITRDRIRVNQSVVKFIFQIVFSYSCFFLFTLSNVIHMLTKMICYLTFLNITRLLFKRNYLRKYIKR